MNNNEFFNFDSPMVNGDANANQHNPNTLIDVGQRTNALEGDAIRRQAVLETLDDADNFLDEDRTIENYKELLKECYEVLPPVTPQPKTGHWIRTTDKAGYLVWECDKCGWQQRINTNFCPDCGARMVES